MKKSVIAVYIGMAGIIAGLCMLIQKQRKSLDKVRKIANKHFALYMLMNRWVQIKQKGKSVYTYLEEKNYERIAIYGMNYVGETLLRELKESNIDVVYAIDQNADHICSDVEVVLPSDKLQEVDAIVVTSFMYFEEIQHTLKGKICCPVISIENIVYSL